MAESFRSRLKNAWNAFSNKENEYQVSYDIGPGYSSRPDRHRIITGSERTIISSIYTRIAIDVASTSFEHVRMDDNDRYLETINSGLNNCLNVEANIDQTGVAFMLDVVISLLDEGCIAVIPTDTSANPDLTSSYDIYSMRVGKIVNWYPRHVRVELYNENTGQRQQVTLSKSSVAIIENPFYSVMNEKNSTMNRLVYKLGLLDDADAKSVSSNLDMIIQLPYTVKTPTQEKRAEDRRKSIEAQLTGSKYGIAYIDSTEKVTQLNRSLENNLLSQVEKLTNQLYSQLGMDETILNGTANSDTMNNYYQRTVAPIIKVIKDEFIRKFISKTARTQRQSIMTFQDPFRYMTVTQIANLVDPMSRNEVLTPNEFRTALGFKPSENPDSDELRNRNLIDVNSYQNNIDDGQEMSEEDYQNALAQLDQSDSELDQLDSDLSHSIPDFLEHYASPYYDPVKAHEYYMKTRELKGTKKTSTAGLTDEGKAAASYVKNQLSEERKAKIKEARAKSKQTVAQTKQHISVQIAQQTANASAQMRLIKAKMAHASTEEKLKYKSQIASMKAKNNKIRASLQAQMRSASSGSSQVLSEQIKKIIADYKAKQESELENIASDSGFQKKTSS